MTKKPSSQRKSSKQKWIISCIIALIPILLLLGMVLPLFEGKTGIEKFGLNLDPNIITGIVLIWALLWITIGLFWSSHNETDKIKNASEKLEEENRVKREELRKTDPGKYQRLYGRVK